MDCNSARNLSYFRDLTPAFLKFKKKENEQTANVKCCQALPGAGCRSFHSVEIKISITFMRCSVFSEL
jgi:hypothetical protein